MRGALVAAALAAWASREAQAAEGLRVGARAPVVTVVAAPRGASPRFAQSDLLAAADRVFRARTDLAVRSAEQVGIDRSDVARCEELACWVRAARSRIGEGYLLLLVLHSPAGKPARLSAVLADLRAADAADASGAVVGSMGFVDVASEGDLAEVMERMVSESLRSELERSGRWEPFGEIEVRAEPDGAAISVDAVPLGAVQGGAARLVDVPAGERAIELSRPGFTPYAARVTVEAGHVARVEARLQQQREETAARAFALWGGIAASAAGAVFLTAGGVTASASGEGSVCLMTTAEACPSGRFARVAGVPAVPLGYSLLSLGTAWWAGSTFVEDEAPLPWRSLVAGVAIGAAAFAISAAADPAGPSE